MPARVVVLVSGSGTLLQALLDACAGPEFPANVVAVGADREGIEGLARARRAGVAIFTHSVQDYPSRRDWDRALADSCERFAPDLIVSAGFMKLVGAEFLARFSGRYINSHPALLPAFPGMHAVSEALRYGVRVTGCTLFLVDAGVDTGPIIDQMAVAVYDHDDETSLHQRIKESERRLLVDNLQRMVVHGWTVQERRVSIP